MNLKKELGGVADAVTKIMDEALKGNQHKIDANKNNKIDAHDFKLLRSKKKVEEEAEQIDELSKNTLRSYLKGSRAENQGSLGSAGHMSDKARSLGRTDDHKDDARYQGAKDAKKRLNAMKEDVELTQDEAQMLASLSQEEFNSLTEEEQDLFIEYFQPLDEISTGAAKNYLKKAVSSSSKLNQKSAKPGEAEAEKYNYSHGNAPYETKQFEKFSKRRTGIRKAITKLASAHPDNKKLATTARQAFNKIHNANYRIGMDGAKNTPDDVKHVKQQHSIIHKAVNSMKEAAERINEEKHKGIFVHAEVEDGSHDDVDNVKHMHTRIAAAAKEHGGKIHSKERPTLSGGGFSIHASGPSEFHKAVHHIVKTSHPLISAQHELDEEAERIDEYKSTGGVYKHKGTYGTEKSLEAGYTDYDKENELAKKNLKTKKPKKYGARQNFVRSTRVNESFTSILASYKENGLKGIAEMFATEQASQEEYDKEIEKAKAKSQGKDKAEVAKASVQAVKSEQTHTKIEVIDMSDPYNIQKREIDLEERKMSDAEMEKKEDIVKGMKKGMKGFKERYGERAKEVMYATATKQAMKD